MLIQLHSSGFHSYIIPVYAVYDDILYALQLIIHEARQQEAKSQ